MIFSGWIRRALNLDDDEPEPLWDYIPIDGEPAPEYPKPFYFATSYHLMGETYPGMYTSEHSWSYWMSRVRQGDEVSLDDPEFLEWITTEYVEEGAQPVILKGDVIVIPKEKLSGLLDIVAFIEVDYENATLTVEGWADPVTCINDGTDCGGFYILSRDDIERGPTG